MIPFIVLAVVVIVLLVQSTYVIPQGQSGVKERLGRTVGPVGPGLHVIVPFIDRIILGPAGPQKFSADIGKIKVSVNYKVTNAAALRQNVGDLNSAFKMAFESRLKKHLDGNLTAVSSIDLSRVEGEFHRDMADVFRDWGVEVEQSKLEVR